MSSASPAPAWTLADQLRDMSQHAAIGVRDKQGRMCCIVRVTDRLWHVERDRRPLRGGSLSVIVKYIQEEL